MDSLRLNGKFPREGEEERDCRAEPCLEESKRPDWPRPYELLKPFRPVEANDSAILKGVGLGERGPTCASTSTAIS